MKAIFDKRRQEFQARLTKYLPYVFNDHFVLVFLVGLGAVLYQYRELLNYFPTNPIWVYLGLSGVQGVLLGLGQVATYVQAPDRHYLLTKEEELLALIKVATIRAQVFWSLVQGLSLLAAFPLLLKAGWQVWSLVVLLVSVLACRWWVMGRRGKRLLTPTGLDWSRVVTVEAARQQAMLRFFALFTRVKGLKSASKPRVYLNPFLGLVKKAPGCLYHNLYWRAFLRSGDYLGLTLRLLGLSVLVQLVLPDPLLAAVVALLLDLLLVFQLLGLAKHYDHQVLLTIAPQGLSKKKTGLLSVLRGVLGLAWIIQVPLSETWPVALLLTLGTLVLAVGYLPLKLGKAVDEAGKNG